MTLKKSEKSHSGCFKRKKKRRLSQPYLENQDRSLSGLGESKIEKLPRELETGGVISLIASTLPNCQGWSVNLLCGRGSSSADIAFHFNPRLLQHYVVRNSRLKGQWGNEESLLEGKFQIKHGEEFTLEIYTADDEFFVAYNKKHVCNFEFRVPPNQVTYIEINGMVDIYNIGMERFEEYPPDNRDVFHVKEIDRPVTSKKHLEMPLRGSLPEGIEEECQLEIYGTPKILPQSFSISLNSGLSLWPHCTVALQITANFGNNMLVRNAFIDNKWGNEERIGGFKFLPSTPFSLWIRRSTRKYSIWINEKLQAEFAYRCDPDIVKSVFVQGDVYVSGIHINKNPEKYFHAA